MGISDELFDRRVANEFSYLPAIHTEPPQNQSGDFAWMEKFIPYSQSAENYFHWFVRF